MGKVDFQLSDSLVRRHARRTETPPAASLPAPAPGSPADVPAARREIPGTRLTAAAAGAEVERRPVPSHQSRSSSIQTSVLLAPSTWDRLERLAGDAGGLASANGLLIDILLQGPESLQEATDELERFLALPAEQTAVGKLWQERNVRFPLALRERLDEHRRVLRAAGARHVTRGHLIAATLHFHAPADGEQAHALMARRRAEVSSSASGASA